VDNLLVNPRGESMGNFRLFSAVIAPYCSFGQYSLMARRSFKA
jgi:hypothetical protein